jgi:hypothetical protein
MELSPVRNESRHGNGVGQHETRSERAHLERLGKFQRGGKISF